MSPLLVAVIGVAMLGLGLYGIRDFRRWNSRRVRPVGLRSFLAMAIAVLVFPALVILGALVAVEGLASRPAG